MIAPDVLSPPTSLPIGRLRPSPFSTSIYGDPASETADLVESIRAEGVLVPLVVAPHPRGLEILSGHRRWACARLLNLTHLPCVVREIARGPARRRAILEYNRQRRKSFRQLMKEADALETLLSAAARRRQVANLRRGAEQATAPAVRRDPDARAGRTDAAIAEAIGIGGKDLYRQARTLWRLASEGDIRASAAVDQVDAGSKTIHAAHKDLRRRDRFTSGFRPTPYDVWAFRHDPAFGVPHPGAIPPAIIAHTLHYFSAPDALVVDPMAGGGATLDVCRAMGRRCLAYDIHPTRPDIDPLDVLDGLPGPAIGCDLVFCDPPYHTMLNGRYGRPGAGEFPFTGWISFLQQLSRVCVAALRPGGHVALLLANQSEKDIPRGQDYLDHGFLGFQALTAAGFIPVRRISCPMSGAYLPQHVRRARQDGRMLGQVRDLLVMRKPGGDHSPAGSPPANS